MVERRALLAAACVYREHTTHTFQKQVKNKKHHNYVCIGSTQRTDDKVVGIVARHRYPQRALVVGHLDARWRVPVCCGAPACVCHACALRVSQTCVPSSRRCSSAALQCAISSSCHGGSSALAK